LFDRQVTKWDLCHAKLSNSKTPNQPKTSYFPVEIKAKIGKLILKAVASFRATKTHLLKEIFDVYFGQMEAPILWE